MQDEPPEHAIRVVTRVADTTGRVAQGTVRGSCSSCDEPVWVMRSQPLPPEAEGLPQFYRCTRCIVEAAVSHGDTGTPLVQRVVWVIDAATTNDWRC